MFSIDCSDSALVMPCAVLHKLFALCDVSVQIIVTFLAVQISHMFGTVHCCEVCICCLLYTSDAADE